ncbi:MAG: hypothetical protein IT422_03155 [Pirellulaceae bacterium]|nr:hypothetical protein [Pirellulaceae bacterium]
MATANNRTKPSTANPPKQEGEWTQYDPHGLLKAIQAMRAEADEMEGLAATLAERANRLRIRAEKAIQLAVLATPAIGKGTAMNADTPQELPVAVRLRYEDQLEYSDIAERLGVSILEARKLVSQGASQVRKEYAQGKAD